jgi:hypothetical protein
MIVNSHVMWAAGVDALCEFSNLTSASDPVLGLPFHCLPPHFPANCSTTWLSSQKAA